MDRTYRAALLAALLVGGSLAGLGVFLGFPTGGSVWFGLIIGILSGALLLAASRRADSFHPTQDNAHLADHGTDFDPADAPDAPAAQEHPTDDDPDRRSGD